MREKQDINDLLIRIGFFVLFCLMICSFSEKSINQNHDIAKQEIVFAIKSNITKAVSVVSPQLPAYQKDWVVVVDKANFRFSDISLVKFSDTNEIIQKYSYLQKQQQIIKPKLITRFYYLLFSQDSDEFSILS